MAAAASKKSHGVVPYNIAKGCYESFEFDPRIRDISVQNVRSNLESFYVFYDIAKIPPQLENSDLNPVDLSTSLNELGQKTFPNDYTFHQELSHLISQLQDPHTTYRSMCYQQFLFIQPISTYGVYEDGRQQVKVATVLGQLDPRLNNDLLDCEVTHIDGHPAFEVITDFAKTKSYSKDRSVRINKAFSYLSHDRTGGSYDRFSLGSFAQRASIPSKAAIEYKIDCKRTSHNTSLQTTLEFAWTALDATMAPYNDTLSYRKQFCSQDSIQVVKKFVLDSASPDDFKSVRVPALGDRIKAVELYRGKYASFHLLSDGVTGVLRLGTESPNKNQGVHPSFYTNIDVGFSALNSAGATKLIIDLQSNSGGIICWGRYVLQMLFPSTVDSPYIYSLRASPLAQALAKATFMYVQGGASPYDGLVNPNTGDEFDTDSWMIPGSKLPGRDSVFSNKVTDRYCPAVEKIRDDEKDAMFESKDIVILTNGYCGSTCAVLALQLHERYSVRTISVGGEHGKSMVFSSFPGGAVQANNTLWVQRLQQVYDTIPSSKQNKQTELLLPKQLPANGQLTFTFRQIMSISHPDQVYEYMRIPSDFRIDYNVARFRMPSILWEDVRDQVWGKPWSMSTGDDSKESSQEEGEQVEYFGNGNGARIVVMEESFEDKGIELEDDERVEWIERFEL
ncbi:hypothetical protein BGZ46_006258 [Entomortierella lignicola]|nr:hypothetical protein BGZ46_006258 [Entomortierella lignicola]